MRGKIIRIWPIMQCPECEDFTPGGDRRPGIDSLYEEFFWKCKCGWKGMTKAVKWEGKLEGIKDEPITHVILHDLERTILLSAGDKIVARFVINNSRDVFGEGFISEWEVREY